MVNYLEAKIAPGWDNFDDLTLFTQLTTSPSSFKYRAVRAIGNYNPGVLEQRGDNSLTVAGMESSMLVWDYWEEVEYYTHFQNTFCGGARSYSGQVTIYIPTRIAGTYGYFNAWVHLPKENEMNYEPDSGWFRDVRIPLLELESITP